MASLRVGKGTWTPRDVKNRVHQRLPPALCDELIEFLRTKDLVIWGSNYVDEYFPLWVYIALFRLVCRKAINRLSKGLIQHPFKTPNTTVSHNCNVIIEAVREWADQQLVWGTRADWDEAAANLGSHRIEGLRRVRLWADSSDFGLPRRKAIRSKKGEWWSFKENRPAQRYMMISDGSRRIRALWGGYSPKVYDSNFLKTFLAPYEASLRGVAIIGDNHFLAAGKHFKGRIEIIAPTTESGNRKKRAREDPDNPAVGYVEETQEETRLNAAIRHVRARVEQPFGAIKARFKCFEGYWTGTPEQQDVAVRFAAAVHNWLLDNVDA